MRKAVLMGGFFDDNLRIMIFDGYTHQKCDL